MPAKLITEVKPGEWVDGRVQKWFPAPGGMDGGSHGCIEHRVIYGIDGKPKFDRAVVREGSHVIVLAWGVDNNGQGRLALAKETRDTAAPLDGVSTIAFWGPPRGFRKVDESPEDAARRVVGEEAGARICLHSRYLGDYITNETTTSSWSPIVEMRVDLERLGSIREDRSEKFFETVWFTSDEIKSFILSKEHDGASTRSMVFMTVASLFVLANTT